MVESHFSMGMAWRRSRPLPCGTPSMMSMSTTSANSFDAIQWAAVAPTFPEPTTVTLLRMISSRSKTFTTKNTKEHEGKSKPFLIGGYGYVHVFDHTGGELAGSYFLGAFH